MWAPVLVLALMGLASAWGVMGVALVASLLAVALSRTAVIDVKGYPTQVVAMAGACLLPFAAVRWSESSAIFATTAVLLVAATIFVLRGMKQGAVVSFSHVLIRVLTAGYLLSYLPMIRALEEGKYMTWSFLLALGGLYLAHGLPMDRLPSRSHRWVRPVAGGAASVALAAASVVFLPDTISLLSMLILGLTVAAGGLVGEASEKMFSLDAPVGDRIWRGLGALLFAAPAFFYAFRLYLT